MKLSVFFKLSYSQKNDFCCYIKELLKVKQTKQMKRYIQHGQTSTYHHCILVAYCSYWLCYKLKLKCNLKSVVRGAFLHDFYLYDWHAARRDRKIHGFYHPQLALSNAKRYFDLNNTEEEIIKKHMWPLTFTKLPKCKEAIVVCLVDKFCAALETMHFKSKFII